MIPANIAINDISLKTRLFGLHWRCMTTDGHRTKWRINIAENFNRLSMVHERYRRQTNRRTGDDIRHIANVNVSSLKWWDLLRTRAIPERLRGVFTTRRYRNPGLPLPVALSTPPTVIWMCPIFCSFGVVESQAKWTCLSAFILRWYKIQTKNE